MQEATPFLSSQHICSSSVHTSSFVLSWNITYFAPLSSPLRPLTVLHHTSAVFNGAIDKFSSRALHHLRDRGIRCATSTEQGRGASPVRWRHPHWEHPFHRWGSWRAILFQAAELCVVAQSQVAVLHAAALHSSVFWERGERTGNPPASTFSLQPFLMMVHIFCPVLTLRKKVSLCFTLPAPACSSNGSSCSMGTHLPLNFTSKPKAFVPHHIQQA